MCEIILEKFGAPAVFFSKDAVLSCYASGRTSGIIIDYGSSGTVITPVLDGWVDMKGLSRSIVGGRYMDNYLLDLLNLKPISPHSISRPLTNDVGDRLSGTHPSFDAIMQLEYARDIKETVPSNHFEVSLIKIFPYRYCRFVE
jgi:actin-related protein